MNDADFDMCFDDRFQCGDGGVQEYKFHSVGRRRSGQDSATVEALLPEHTRSVFLAAVHFPGFLCQL